MISIKELKASYIGVLRACFPHIKIYSTTVEDGYETPSFFVQILPMIFRHRETASVARSNYIFETTFLEKEKNEVMQLEVVQKIREALGDHLKVGERKLFIEEPEVQFTGQGKNIIQFIFQVDFLEDYRELPIEKIIKELKMKEVIKNGDAKH